MIGLAAMATVGMIHTAQPVGRMIDGVFCHTCTRTTEEAIRKPRHITKEGVIEPPEKVERRHDGHRPRGEWSDFR